MKSHINATKVMLLISLIFMLVVYVLLITGIAKETKTHLIVYPEHSHSVSIDVVNNNTDQWLSALILQPNLIQRDQDYFFVMNKSDHTATVIPFVFIFQTVIRDLMFFIAMLILVTALVYILALRQQKTKFDKLLNPMSDKAERSIEIFGKIEQASEAYSPLSRLSQAIEDLSTYAKRFKTKAERSAYIDKLTQLINRHTFLDHIKSRIEFKNSSEFKSALLFIDLDGFKQVNDSFGHSFGDEILIQVAERLNTVVRANGLNSATNEEDIEYNLARLGGDEFTLFVETVMDNSHIIKVSQHVLSELERDFVLGNKIIKISASIGIAVYPDSANSPEALLQMADVAMYRAKSEGRGIYRIYSPEMGSKMRRYHYLLEEMRVALATNSFYLSFQPIIHTDGCMISYFEALVRWDHPVEGGITPGEFIPIAEDSNLILELGDWILHEACRQMSAWYNAGMRKSKISINVSPIQLKNIDILDWVSKALDKSGLPPTALMLEVTESSFVELSDDIVGKLQQLRDKGVSIAIDDFGTGFSSLSLLANLPVDVLKIDRMFISESTSNPKYHKILLSIVDLSERLGLKVVAEGIEELEQLELLKSLGIHYIQGYLISRPQSSRNVGNKVFQHGSNHVSQLGTGVWSPQVPMTKVQH